MPLTGSRWDIRWLIGRRTKPTFCVFPVFARWRLWKSVVTLAVTGNTISGRVYSASEGASVSVASIAVEGKSMGHTVADRSLNEADFLCISCLWRGG
jgi:hypothetical protein